MKETFSLLRFKIFKKLICTFHIFLQNDSIEQKKKKKYSIEQITQRHLLT